MRARLPANVAKVYQPVHKAVMKEHGMQGLRCVHIDTAVSETGKTTLASPKKNIKKTKKKREKNKEKKKKYNRLTDSD